MTKAVFRFLLDYRDQLMQAHLQRWANNEEFPGNEEEAARQRTLAVAEILLIEPVTIAQFYLGPEDAGHEDVEIQKQLTELFKSRED
jgi:hypothetical protein